MVRIEPTADDSLAAARARNRFGMAIAAMPRMMATTVSSSINEKPLGSCLGHSRCCFFLSELVRCIGAVHFQTRCTPGAKLPTAPKCRDCTQIAFRSHLPTATRVSVAQTHFQDMEVRNEIVSRDKAKNRRS